VNFAKKNLECFTNGVFANKIFSKLVEVKDTKKCWKSYHPNAPPPLPLPPPSLYTKVRICCNPAKGRVEFEDGWLIKSSFITKDEMKLVS
jgi:hypothetical protein